MSTLGLVEKHVTFSKVLKLSWLYQNNMRPRDAKM